MSKPDALTVVPGQMVAYHNETPASAIFVDVRPLDLSSDKLEELYQLVSAAADSGDPGAVARVLTPALVSSLSVLDIVRVCGWLVGLLDSKAR